MNNINFNKKIVISILVIFAVLLVLLVFLRLNHTNEIITRADIKAITAMSQTTDNLRTVNVPSGKQSEIVEILNSLKKKKVKMDDFGGWQYSFWIEFENAPGMSISIMDDIMTVSGEHYEISGYEPGDFDFLFEQE